MIRLDGHERIEGALRGGVIALGNFDGFHAGHQAVVGRAVHHAKDDGRPAIVATFDPHPVRFFKPDVPPFRLTTLDQRQQLFGAAGADAMLVLPFDAALAATTAEDFITELLLERYGAAGVVTGADFVFGKGRGGDVVTLADHARRLGFFTEMVAPVDDSAEAAPSMYLSSARIRSCPSCAIRRAVPSAHAGRSAICASRRGVSLGGWVMPERVCRSRRDATGTSTVSTSALNPESRARRSMSARISGSRGG